MAAPREPIYFLPQKSQDALIEYFKQTVAASFDIVNLRNRFEYIDLEYYRENQLHVESLQAKAANQAGNKRKIQDAVIPIIEPQVETAHSYLCSVFLTGMPMFGVVSDEENADEALQLETVIENQSINPSSPWTRQFSMFFRDGLKYNFSAVEVDWCVEKTWSVVTDTNFDTTGAKGKPQEINWQGNKVKRIDPYNTLFDLRVPISEQHISAEFVGYVEMYNRPSLMSKLMALPNRMNYTKAMECEPVNTMLERLYYIPRVFTENFTYTRMVGMMDWNSWAFGAKGIGDMRIRFKNLYYLVTRYCRIVPADFGMTVPNAKQVQIWKFVTVNDQVLVFAERQTNAHNLLPIIFGQPIEDGLNLQTKSLAQKLIPMQDLGSAHANAHLAARRRAVSDRMLYDPSRVNEKDINSDSPTAKIPCRPNAYGQPLEKAVYPFPFKWEESRGVMADVREVFSYSELIAGQNKAQQGQFVKGNKTKSEFEDIMGKASGRQQTQAIHIEAQVMMPCKHIIKYNILQYQPAGEMYSSTTKQPVKINPQELRKKALIFKISDGLMPSDKILDADTMAVALQMAGQPGSPLSEEYNAGKIAVHLIKSKGVDLDQYKYTDEEKKQRQQMMLERIQAETNAKQQPQPMGARNGAQG